MSSKKKGVAGLLISFGLGVAKGATSGPKKGGGSQGSGL